MTTQTTADWTPAERAAFAAKRRSRNIALGVLLGLLVVLFFGITIVKMKDGPAVSPAAAVAP